MSHSMCHIMRKEISTKLVNISYYSKHSKSLTHTPQHWRVTLWAYQGSCMQCHVSLNQQMYNNRDIPINRASYIHVLSSNEICLARRNTLAIHDHGAHGYEFRMATLITINSGLQHPYGPRWWSSSGWIQDGFLDMEIRKWFDLGVCHHREV